jgi:hypothetical protein
MSPLIPCLRYAGMTQNAFMAKEKYLGNLRQSRRTNHMNM